MRFKKSTISKAAGNKTTHENDLILKRIGGGSIIDHRPLFSHDGEIVFVVWKHSLRAYSTRTGDFCREFEGIENKIAGIWTHPDNSQVIVACSDVGELIFWNCYNGLVIKKVHLQIKDKNVKVKTFHIVNYETNNGSNVLQALVTYPVKQEKKIRLILFNLDSGEFGQETRISHFADEYHVDTVGEPGCHLIALVQDNNLHILNPGHDFDEIWHKTQRPCTAVAGHPRKACVATGDSSGRVLIWENVFKRQPTKGTYHWHTLPVTEIAFSSIGSHLYTGGGECVLVKWVLGDPKQKSYLPRLPAPIKHVSIASEDRYVAVATLDNGILVVNPQWQILSVVQNFTWGVSVSRKNLFPAGLTMDPRTNCVVLNSRTGHVQFYNTHTKSLLYNINITAQNQLTQERNVVIVNTEVTKVALSQNGSWMATVEQRDDEVSDMEVRLKFWQFNAEQQIFTLNTSIEYPHDGAVNALCFQSNGSLDSDQLIAATTGTDKKYKIWRLAESASIYRNTRRWYCYIVGLYRHLPATDATFSVDGSLLAIGFGSTLTAWDPDTNQLKCSLTHSNYPQTIDRIEFGRAEAAHLIVVGSIEHIVVWNLLTLTIAWSVPLQLSTLAADGNSVYMAAFTTDRSLFIFNPLSSKPVYTKRNVTDKDSVILAASFVPHLGDRNLVSTGNWQQKSQLFFLDSNQELLTLETASEISKSLENLTLNTNLPSTAFSALVAAQSTTSKETVQPYMHNELGLPGKGILQELLSVPSHTLPPMRLLCAPFILSFMSQATSFKKKSSSDTSNSKIHSNDMSDDSGNESDNETGTRKVDSVSLPNSEMMETTDESQKIGKLVSIDWTEFTESLSAILPSGQVAET